MLRRVERKKEAHKEKTPTEKNTLSLNQLQRNRKRKILEIRGNEEKDQIKRDKRDLLDEL